MHQHYQRLKNFLKGTLIDYNNFAFRNFYKIFFVVMILTIVGGWFAFRLSVKTDFFELLPENYRSIGDLNKVIDRVGGVGNLIIAVETKNPAAAERFVDDVANDIKKLPKSMVTDVNYHIKDLRKFYEDNSLIYMDKEDLVKVKNRLAAKLDYEKKKNNPLYFFKEFLTPVKFNIDDIKKKYEDKTGKDENSFKNGYINGYNQTLYAIMIKPRGSAAGITEANVLIKAVDKILAEHPTEKYDPSIKTHLCGNVKSMVEEYDIIITDVVSTLLLVFGLVGLVIFIFLGTISSIFILLLNLAIASIWTMGITYLHIGYLNSQTAFLASLIIGTGVNYGIIYLARYYEERKNGRSIHESLMTSSQTTIVQTFLASSTAAVAFITLMFAHTRGFSQFGFIGSIGIILCWVNTFIILPVFVLTWEKISAWMNIRAKIRFHFNILKHISPIITKYYMVMHIVLLAITVATCFYVIRYYPNRYETDFSKLRNAQSTKHGTAYWDEKVGNMFGKNTSLTPAVVVVDTPEEGEQICESIDKKMAELPPKFRKIASCYSVNRMLPDNQKDKLPIIKEIKNLLYSGSIKFVKDDLYDDIIKFRKKIKTRPLNMDDLPYTITKNFEDIYGNKGVIVVVNPLMEQKLTENLITFAELVRENKLHNGRIIYSSGEAVIYADLLKAIDIDGPRVTIYSFLLVILMVLISVRNMKDTTIIIMTLLAGVVFMFGLIAFYDIKLNFFNFIAFPLTFGICVDYGANIYLRYKQENDIQASLNKIGQAVFLCSLTTIVSYITLLVAKNQALVSFAQLALIGEITSLFGAFMVLPALIVTIDKLSARKKRGLAGIDKEASEKTDTDKKKEASKQDYFIDYQ
ncbi:MAG: MMPL family transporter [Proteobacteria bacterium]|nr:MMPL family transporter [Pseudomonadota bacterium]